MLVSLPRTCHDIIFNSVFSSLLFFVAEPWKPLFFLFICTHICFALSFPSSPLLIKHLGLIPAKCQMCCAGSWAEIPLLIKSPFLNSLSCSCQPRCQTIPCLPKSPQQQQTSGSQHLSLLACAEKRQLKTRQIWRCLLKQKEVVKERGETFLGRLDFAFRPNCVVCSLSVG